MTDLTPEEREIHTLLTRGVFDSPSDRARHILEALKGSSSAGDAIRASVPLPEQSPTLEELREDLAGALDDGTHCPVCGRFARRYRRQVNSSMARKLIAAWRRFGPDWFDMPAFIREEKLQGRDESVLAYFGLIESSFGKREDGGRDGVWRVTSKGAQWIEKGTTIPRYAVVYDGHVQGHEGPDRTIQDALGNGFRLDVLMGYAEDSP